MTAFMAFREVGWGRVLYPYTFNDKGPVFVGMKDFAWKNVDMDDGLFEVTLVKNPLNPAELDDALQRVLNRRGSPPLTRLIVGRAAQENRYVSETIRYIAAHYSEPSLTVRGIARALELSEGHLSRLFKEKTGYTLKNYLTLYRIGVAEDLLSDCRSRVYETAKQVGYQDVAYFSNTFKRVVGVSPTEYRNEKEA